MIPAGAIREPPRRAAGGAEAALGQTGPGIRLRTRHRLSHTPFRAPTCPPCIGATSSSPHRAPGNPGRVCSAALAARPRPTRCGARPGQRRRLGARAGGRPGADAGTDPVEGARRGSDRRPVRTEIRPDAGRCRAAKGAAPRPPPGLCLAHRAPAPDAAVRPDAVGFPGRRRPAVPRRRAPLGPSDRGRQRVLAQHTTRPRPMAGVPGDRRITVTRMSRLM